MMNGHGPHARAGRSRSTLAWAGLLLGAVALASGAGCTGLLEVEDSSTAVVLESMDPGVCTADWNEPDLPSDFRERIDLALTDSFAEIKHQVQSAIDEKGIGNVDTVHLEELVLRVGNPPEARTAQNTLGFLTSLRIYLESSQEDTLLPRILLAHHDDIPETATSLTLTTADVDLLPYHDEGIRLVTEVEHRTCLAEDLVLRFTYRVQVRYLPE